MPVITFSKAPDETTADVLLAKFFERLQIDFDGTAISVLEFIVQVKDDSPLGLSKLDIIIPHIVSEVEDVTETFTDIDLFENQIYTEGLKLLDDEDEKYSIDGVEAYLKSLSSPPKTDIKDDYYTVVRIKFNKIIPGTCGAFRLKMTIPNFANIYKSVGVFELPIYYAWALSSHIETMHEWGVNGIPINRKLCETWVTLPKDTLCGKAIPPPQQIKVRHMYQMLSNAMLDPPRSAVYWDLEDTVFDLPGRSLGDYINPGEGVRIYCETTKPHTASETFETTMNAASDTMKNLMESVIAAENSLEFIAKHGKKSFIITLILSAIAIIISIIALIKNF